MKQSINLMLFLTTLAVYGQDNRPIGVFENYQDVGGPKNKGSLSFNEEDQVYTLSGSGYNIWFERDEFYYAYNRINGDFIITANFGFIGEGADPHRKTGLMVRGSSDDNASHISATLHGDGLTVLQWRELKGAFMRDPEDEVFSPKGGYSILQLERRGDVFIMRAAHPGEPLQLIGSHKMEHQKEEVLVGLFISSHNPEVIEQAQAWNVRIDRPVVEKNSDMEYRLETINVFDGKRKVVYQNNIKFEAPNWMPDGKKLLFNMEGSLFTLPVDGGQPEKLNTGLADKNNNDHGISFDGKMLAISHHREGKPGYGSTVYVLPVSGGEPQLVTEETPSYWHGWSPNGKEVAYVAQRKGSDAYNIYKKPIKGGKEVALTNNPPGVHADGCEYTPDGKYIYYNSSASGTMQIWRMGPDGSRKEQVTFDEYNDWFPHVSPDGKWILFMSYPTGVAPNDHPANQRVVLRLMPAGGGAPKVIAYLYGGQGTINVPSWSPDSKNVAFVSYTARIK